ncbi:MAG: hypothetical protein HZA00_07055 [Nitrospinae bacterium]|nr:hypothetical protein [Nitrospinota bacterium]
MKAVTGKKVTDKYFFNYMGYTVKDVGIDKVEGTYQIQISVNPAYWGLYREVLEQINEYSSIEDTVLAGALFGKSSLSTRYMSMSLYDYIIKSLPRDWITQSDNGMYDIYYFYVQPVNRINKHLQKYLEKPFNCKINILPGGNFTLEIYQNLFRKDRRNYLLNDEKPVIIDVPFRITNMNGINRFKIIVE